ncbi:MAG: hypothetical protein LW860_14990, partial [Xanthomonadaceae bacterium]|nr:hypothetical protein [Xanthomonadaceae bacterium]
MKLSAARETYYSHSGNASTAARQIAFAGIAVVWIFNQPNAGRPIELPELLMSALLLLCTSLALDLMQYSLSAAVWGYYSRSKERELGLTFPLFPAGNPLAHQRIARSLPGKQRVHDGFFLRLETNRSGGRHAR